MKRGIFREIFFLYSAVSILSVVALGFYLDSLISSYYLDKLHEDLSGEASLIGARLRETPEQHFGSLVRESQEIIRARVTVIDRDGVVISDSHSDPRLMENHGGRVEVKQAFSSETGTASRRSSTVGADLYYVAQRIELSSGPIVVRISLPLNAVDRVIRDLRNRILGAVVLVFAGAGAFAFLQIRRVKNAAARISRFSGEIAGGDLDSRLYFDGFEEFDRIAEHLNVMAAKLKDMLAMLTDEANRLGVILEGIPHALLILDRGGTIVLSSRMSRDFFDQPRINGRNVKEVVRSGEFHRLLRVVEAEQAPLSEDIAADPHRERYWSVRISPFHERDSIGGYIAIFNDITQLVKIEQVRKDFVANASHEIKTPITAIRGFTDTLLDGAIDDPENATRFLEIIRVHSERINRLVDDLMTISKIELGVIPIEKQELDLQEIVENVVLTFEDRANRKGLSLHSWVRQEKREIFADRDRLFQILANLLDNAIKFTETGSIAVGTGVEEGRWYLYVKDSGIGIPEDHLPRIGERFYRVDPSRSRELGGTGLGLAIVKHLVRAHGWDWAIESTPGRGTRVRVFFEEPAA